MNDHEFFNFATVLDAVPARIDELITHLLPNARRQTGCYRVGGLDGEKGDSLSISTKPNNAGTFIDFQDQSVKGNAISLWAMVKGQTYQEAGRELARFLNVQPEVRLHAPKRRPPPKIERERHKFSCGGREQSYAALNKRSINYAATRGLGEAVLKAARCASTPTHIVFPHFNEEDELVLLKCWSCDGEKQIFTNDDPVPVLFGKHMVDPIKSGSSLIICEGHWDALTWQQLGYPAVSIPSGASNDDWIGEDYNFLNCFSQIYLDFDDDAAGREAESRVRIRLGYERCRSLRYRFKDANAALQAGESQVLIDAFQHALEAPIERIVNPQEMRSQVRDRLNRTHMRGGTPFFLPQANFEFRPHEITLWFGVTSHGKSTILSNQICHAASQGKLVMVASFEQNTPMTAAAMLSQYTANADLGASSDFDDAYASLTSRVFFFDSMLRANPDELIATMIMAHKQLGVEEFVVDNIMTLELDRQDNTAQAQVADKFRVFAAQYPIHLHLVAHPRKPPANEATRPPSIADVMGASEWAAMAHNAICVWRDVGKAQRLAEMRDDNLDPLEIQAFDETVPDGKIFWRKQRETGDLPMVSYRFHNPTKRAWKNPEDLRPYWTPILPDDGGLILEE